MLGTVHVAPIRPATHPLQGLLASSLRLTETRVALAVRPTQASRDTSHQIVADAYGLDTASLLRTAHALGTIRVDGTAKLTARKGLASPFRATVIPPTDATPVAVAARVVGLQVRPDDAVVRAIVAA